MIVDVVCVHLGCIYSVYNDTNMEGDKTLAYEATEKKILEEHLNSFRCNNGCADGLKIHGYVKYAVGVRRAQLRCKGCTLSIMLHRFLEAHKQFKFKEAFEQIDSAFKEIIKGTKGSQGQDLAVNKEEVSMNVCVDGETESDLEVCEDSSVHVEVSAQKTYAAKRLSESSHTPARASGKVQATPNRSSFGFENDYSEVIANQNEDIKVLKAIVAAQEAQIQLQNQKIEEMRVLMKEMLTANGTSKYTQEKKAPQANSKASKAQSGADTKASMPTPPPAKDETETPIETEESRRTPYKDMLNKGMKWLPKKVFIAAKKCVKPYKAPSEIVKIYMNFSWDGRYMKSRRDGFMLVYQMFGKARVKGMVEEVSFVGKSILEVYVRQSNAEEFKKLMTTWADAREDLFVSADDVLKYSSGKLSASEMKVKAISRATFLCARNTYVPLQDCILADIDSALHEEVKTQAEIIRKGWQSAKSKREEGK